MDELVRVVVSVVVAILAAWILLLVGLLMMRPGGSSESVMLKESVRLLPDLIRLVLRLAKDLTLPRGIRAWLAVLVVYLAMPFDLVPDFIPVLGYADDVIAILWVLRKVIRAAGVASVHRHWPGTETGLATLLRVTSSGTSYRGRQ